MKTLLIVWYSYTGGSRQMAEAAAGAASEQEGIRVHMVPAESAGPEDVLEADGYLFIFPENLAAIAGVMKAFFDRCYYPVLGRIEGRPYSVLLCAGSDGTNALRQVQRIATGWRLREVVEPIILCTQAQTPEAILAEKTINPDGIVRCQETGAIMGAGLSLGVF